MTTPNNNLQLNLSNPLLIPNKRGRKPGTKTKNDSTPSEAIEADEDSNSDDASDDEQKKIRRLEKNREAAQLFRMRQKAYITELEKQLQTLSTENADYKSKVDLLRTENKFIKDQLAFLHNFISHAISLSFPTGSAMSQIPQIDNSQTLPNMNNPNLMNMMTEFSNMINGGNINPSNLMQLLGQFSNVGTNNVQNTSSSQNPISIPNEAAQSDSDEENESQSSENDNEANQ